MKSNLDRRTVEGFGRGWSRLDQSVLPSEEARRLFAAYFRMFPWHFLPPNAVGFDLGCGSGRWARFVAERVGVLHCIDASEVALRVAKRNLRGVRNCHFYVASAEAIPLPDHSMAFGYSLGVLHHVPDALSALKACVAKLKPRAPFLVYLYYALDNRPGWYRTVWQISDRLRRVIARLPFTLRYWISQGIAVLAYYPMARAARLLETAGLAVDGFPLATYRNLSFYSMRTDALDRFGTRLEKRFTATEVRQLMHEAGLDDVLVSALPPYWCAVGYARPAGVSANGSESV